MNELIKEGSMRLSPIPEEWPTQILEYLYARYPSLRGRDLSVDFDKFDEESFSALGKVVVKEAKGETIYFPVIVKERNLEEIDVGIKNGKPFPIVDDDIVSLFGEDIFDMTLSGMTPPSSSFYTSATTIPSIYGTDSLKTASDLLEDLARKIPHEEKKKVLKKVANEAPELLEVKEIRKFFEKRGSIPKKQREFDSIYINRGHAFGVTLNPFQIYTTKVGSSIERVIKQNFGGKIASSPETTTTYTDYGVYSVKVGNKRVKGVFIPKTTDFHYVHDEGIFVAPSGVSYTSEVAGEKIASDIELGEVQVGKGVFVLKTSKGAIASQPVEVLESIDGSLLVKTATDSWKLVRDKYLKVPVVRDGHLYLPTSWKFLPVAKDDVFEIMDPADVEHIRLTKAASLNYDKDYRFFSFENCPVPPQEFNAQEAIAVLLALGVDLLPAKSLIKQAKSKGKAHFFPAVPEKQASDSLKKICEQIRVDLSKEAAELYPQVNPSELFSLDLITPETLDSFRKALPLFEDSLEKLATLLLAHRLGVKTASEKSLKTAIRGMYNVVQALRVLNWNIS